MIVGVNYFLSHIARKMLAAFRLRATIQGLTASTKVEKTALAGRF